MRQCEQQKKNNIALTLQISQNYIQKDFENVYIYKIIFNESRKQIIWLDMKEENYTSFAWELFILVQ